jgi:hypothetical protein
MIHKIKSIEIINDLQCVILNNTVDLKYKQLKIKFNNFDIFITYSINEKIEQKNKKAIIYLPGARYYWFYHHVRIKYPDCDFFSIDLPGFGFNSDYKTNTYKLNGQTIKNNYFDIDILIEILNITLITFNKQHKLLPKSYEFNFINYKERNILGFSTGGFIGLYYSWTRERNERARFCEDKISEGTRERNERARFCEDKISEGTRERKEKCKYYNYFKLDELLLINPLTRYYAGTETNTYLLTNLAYITSFYSDTINFYSRGEKKSNHNKYLNKNIKSIFTYMKNYDKPVIPVDKIDKIDLSILLGNYESLLYNGQINTIYIYMSKMIKSNIKINLPVKMICSNKYDNKQSDVTDNVLNPQYMIDDLSKVCSILSYKKLPVSHRAHLKSFKNNDKISFIDVMDYLLYN